MIDEKRLSKIYFELDEHCQSIETVTTKEEAIELVRLARLGLWAEKQGIPAMQAASKQLDGIKSELYASVYTVTDDEFETIYSVRDDLDLTLAALPKEGK